MLCILWKQLCIVYNFLNQSTLDYFYFAQAFFLSRTQSKYAARHSKQEKMLYAKRNAPAERNKKVNYLLTKQRRAMKTRAIKASAVIANVGDEEIKKLPHKTRMHYLISIQKGTKNRLYIWLTKSKIKGTKKQAKCRPVN